MGDDEQTTATSRSAAETLMLRRDLALSLERQRQLEVKLAAARLREETLLSAGRPVATTEEALTAEVRNLKRALDLCWQQRTSLEVRLGDLRVEIAALTEVPAVAPVAATPPTTATAVAATDGGRSLVRRAGRLGDGVRARLRPTRQAGAPPAPTAPAPVVAPAPAPASPLTAPATPSPSPAPDLVEPLDLGSLRCVSVVEQARAGHAGWTLDEVRIGQTDIPVVRVREARYLPARGLTIVDGDAVPLEAVSYASNLAFMTSGERGGTVDAASVHRVEDEVCVLSNLFSMTFGHWLDEELPKVFILEQAGFRGRYVVTAGAPEATLPGFIRESFALLGIPDERILDRLPGVTTFATVVFTPVIVQAYAMRYRDVYLGFRERLLMLAGATDAPPTRRLWMARGAGAENGRRELVNGDAVMELLERHGFEIVDMGARPFAEQLRTARSAAVLAGPHGSGTKHALFQAPGSTVIECFTPNHLNTSIINHCRLLGHRYHMVVQDIAYTDYPWGLELAVPEQHLALLLETLDPV